MVVYRHRRLDTNDVFYIGIGDNKRAHNKSARSVYWKNIVKKHGYSVEILATDLSREDACELEILLIQEYGRKDLGLGKLINMTNGGDGNLNPSEEWKKAASERVKGENNYFFNRFLYGENNGNYGNRWSDEKKKALSDKVKGKKHSEKTKIKWSESRTGGLNSNAKIVLDTQTGIFYDTATDAAKTLDIPATKLHKYLNGQVKNKTYLIYV